MRRDKLRVAVAGGCGDWGRRYTHAYAHHPGAELIALVDTARARRERFAQHYAVPHQFDTVEELLAWQVPDVVANILPVSAARDAVIACAEAGVRGISCEKPIAARLADADAMVAACAERGAAFACGTAWWEVHNIARVGDWVRDGAIGRITGAAIDGFLAHGDQVSGLGCIMPQLPSLRHRRRSRVGERLDGAGGGGRRRRRLRRVRCAGHERRLRMHRRA